MLLLLLLLPSTSALLPSLTVLGKGEYRLPNQQSRVLSITPSQNGSEVQACICIIFLPVNKPLYTDTNPPLFPPCSLFPSLLAPSLPTHTCVQMEESLAKGASEPIKHGCVCCRVHYSDANLSSSLKIFSERHSGLLAISLGKRITGPTCAGRPSPAVLTSRDAAEGEDPSVNFGEESMRCEGKKSRTRSASK